MQMMGTAMDDYFAHFLAKFGPGFDSRAASSVSVDRWRGQLPDQMLRYWQEHGWCGYGQGLFWTVDPQDYEPVAAAWLDGTRFDRHDRYHVVAMGAFGTLYLWGERTGGSLKIIAPDAVALPSQDDGPDLDRFTSLFFSSLNPKASDFSDTTGKPLFSRALNKLGRLKPGEMYGFVPALALGGPATLEHLQRVKAVEHLVMLAQLSELRVSNLLMS
jgi:hypothetical protein